MTSYSVKGKKFGVIKAKKYIISENKQYFIIHPNYAESNVHKEHVTHKEKIIDYSNGDNKIVDVIEITDEYIKTKYFYGWYPLVITENCKIFYTDDEIKKRSKLYLDLLMDYEKLKNLYYQIKKEYIDFENNTGLLFTDKTSNNILINKDFTDFRIIDINSILTFESARKNHCGPRENNSKRIMAYPIQNNSETGLSGPKCIHDHFLTDEILNRIDVLWHPDHPRARERYWSCEPPEDNSIYKADYKK